MASMKQNLPSSKSQMIKSIKEHNDEIAALKAKEEQLMSLINMLESLMPFAIIYYMWKFEVASKAHPKDRHAMEQEVKEKLSRMLKALEDLKKEVAKVKLEQEPRRGPGPNGVVTPQDYLGSTPYESIERYKDIKPSLKPGSHELLSEPQKESKNPSALSEDVLVKREPLVAEPTELLVSPKPSMSQNGRGVKSSPVSQKSFSSIRSKRLSQITGDEQCSKSSSRKSSTSGDRSVKSSLRQPSKELTGRLEAEKSCSKTHSKVDLRYSNNSDPNKLHNENSEKLGIETGPMTRSGITLPSKTLPKEQSLSSSNANYQPDVSVTSRQDRPVSGSKQPQNVVKVPLTKIEREKSPQMILENSLDRIGGDPVPQYATESRGPPILSDPNTSGRRPDPVGSVVAFDDERRPNDDRRRSSDDTIKSPKDARRPLEPARRPPADARRLDDDGQRSPDDARRPPADGRRLNDDGQRPPAVAQRLNDDRRRSPDDSRRTPADARRLNDDGRRSPDDARRPPADARRPNDERRIPTNEDAQTPYENAQRPYDDGKTPSRNKGRQTGDKKAGMAEGSRSKSRLVREVIQIERDGQPPEKIEVQPGMDGNQLQMVEDMIRRMDMEKESLQEEMDRIFGPLPPVIAKYGLHKKKNSEERTDKRRTSVSRPQKPKRVQGLEEYSEEEEETKVPKKRGRGKSPEYPLSGAVVHVKPQTIQALDHGRSQGPRTPIGTRRPHSPRGHFHQESQIGQGPPLGQGGLQSPRGPPLGQGRPHSPGGPFGQEPQIGQGPPLGQGGPQGLGGSFHQEPQIGQGPPLGQGAPQGPGGPFGQDPQIGQGPPLSQGEVQGPGGPFDQEPQIGQGPLPGQGRPHSPGGPFGQDPQIGQGPPLGQGGPQGPGGPFSQEPQIGQGPPLGQGRLQGPGGPYGQELQIGEQPPVGQGRPHSPGGPFGQDPQISQGPPRGQGRPQGPGGPFGQEPKIGQGPPLGQGGLQGPGAPFGQEQQIGEQPPFGQGWPQGPGGPFGQVGQQSPPQQPQPQPTKHTPWSPYHGPAPTSQSPQGSPTHQPPPVDSEVARKIDLIMDKLNIIEAEIQRRDEAEQTTGGQYDDESTPSDVEDFSGKLIQLQGRINEGIDRLENVMSRQMWQQPQW